MAQDRGYVRQTRNGPSVALQIDALRSAGVAVDGEHAPVYIDQLADKRTHARSSGGEGLTQRAAAIHDLRPGARLVVSSLDRLGVSGIDITAAIRKVTAKGCAVLASATGREYTIPPDVGAVLDDAAAAEAVLKAERVSKARAVRADRIAAGNKAAVGGQRAWSPTADEEAVALSYWNNFEMTQTQIAKAVGVSAITLRRRFGERGAPRGRKKTKLKTSPE